MEKTQNEVDHVVAYSKEVLSLGLLYMEFTDSIRERKWNALLALHHAPVQSLQQTKICYSIKH